MINLVVDEIKQLPSGRVIYRWINPNGSHHKMRLFKPNKFNVCDICKNTIDGNAVKTEGGGNHTYLTQCIDCAVDELKEVYNNRKRMLH